MGAIELIRVFDGRLKRRGHVYGATFGPRNLLLDNFLRGDTVVEGKMKLK